MTRRKPAFSPSNETIEKTEKVLGILVVGAALYAAFRVATTGRRIRHSVDESASRFGSFITRAPQRAAVRKCHEKTLRRMAFNVPIAAADLSAAELRNYPDDYVFFEEWVLDHPDWREIYTGPHDPFGCVSS